MTDLDLRQVQPGPAASRALHRAVVRAKAGDPLAPVTVVVPSNQVGVAARRLLASDRLGPVADRGAGLAAVTFVTPYRLAELLGAARLAGTGRRPVSTPVLAAAVRQVLAGEPGLFASVADHPATETALVASYRELRDAPAPALDALAARSRRAADVVRIHRQVRTRLAPGWYDEEDLMAAAAERLAADPAALRGAVVIHLPDRISLHAATLLRAVADAAPTTVVAALCGAADADAGPIRSLARLGLSPTPVPALLPAGGRADDPPAEGRGGARPPAEEDRPAPVVGPDRTRLVSTSDADDEVRAAVRAVVDAARAGTPLDRVAVLHPDVGPYPRLLHEHLAAAEVPVNGAAVTPLAARVAGRSLLRLLDLAERGWSRPAFFAWSSGVPVQAGGRPLPLAAWERTSRQAGVVGGRVHWDERLAHHAEAQEAAAERAETPERAAGARREAARARALRTYVLALVDELAGAGAAPRRWSTHARWAGRLLDRLLGRADQRDRWPDDERRAAERVERALDRLGALDAVEGPVGLEVFTRTLAVELDTEGSRAGPFGTGVLVGPVALGVGLDLDLVVVVGLAEGLLPAVRRDDSLLPDHERRTAGDALALRAEDLGRQHRELLWVLAGAERQVLTWPRGDLRRSHEPVPSRWLLDVASTLAGRRWWADDLHRADAPWVEHVPSFDAGLRRAVPATAQEHRLRSLLAAGAGAEALARDGDPVLAAGAALARARSSPRFTRYDGNLAGVAVASPADPGHPPAAATALETWARCPFAYFLRSVLGVRPVENPEDALAITPLDRGLLVHDVLERFGREVLARPEGERPGPGDPWTEADRARLRALAEAVCDEYAARGLTGRDLFWRRDRARILADLDQTLRFEESVRRQGWWHRAVETAFGTDREVALALPDGRRVRFWGRIDRIDGDGAGRLLVVDYKTGKARDLARLSEADPDLGGTHLQLGVYGAAARAVTGLDDAPVRAEYWFVSAAGEFRQVGYDLTPDVVDRVAETLALVVGGIERGTFPARPPEHDTGPFISCPACDPDGLGVADLRRAWEQKAGDPALASYRDLIDPDRRTGGDRG